MSRRDCPHWKIAARSATREARLARLTAEKLALLKKAFTQDGMAPRQAAQKVGVTYEPAKRWYDKWADEIRRSLESKLVPSMEESVKRWKENGGSRAPVQIQINK